MEYRDDKLDFMEGEVALERMRNDYDWAEAFAYAGQSSKDGTDEDWRTYGDPDLRAASPGDTVSLTPFDLNAVEEVYSASEGENDEANWIAWGKLKDGRFFSLRAGCDYTGWDCQADGHAEVASTKALLEAQGFDESERERLRIG